MINKDTKIFCSFSANPGNNGCTFFNTAFQERGIDAIYKSFFSDDLEKAVDAVLHLGISGFALSMPFKVAILNAAGWRFKHKEPAVEEIGACNTVTNEDGVLSAFNTDWIGAKKYLERHAFSGRLYILGNGGFSKAVQYACKDLGADFELITRSNWNRIGEISGETLFNATPVDVESPGNIVVDGRPHTDDGKGIALLQAKEQFKIYTGTDY